MKKTKRIEIRISDSDFQNLKSKSDQSGISISDLLRQSAERIQTWTAKDKKIESEKIRQLARIGNNLNQIARWCNQHKSSADTLEVTSHLVAIERELKEL